LTLGTVEKVTFLDTLPHKFAPNSSELEKWQRFLVFDGLIRRAIPVKKVERATKGLVENSRMTRRNDRCESSDRILIAAGKEAAFIQSVTMNFRSHVVGPFELRSVERVQNNENDFLRRQNEEPGKERLQRRNQMNQDNNESEQKTEQKGDERCARKTQHARTQKERKGQKN
jgi:hypothetical protein